jgi:hypothetical protein
VYSVCRQVLLGRFLTRADMVDSHYAEALSWAEDVVRTVVQGVLCGCVGWWEYKYAIGLLLVGGWLHVG